jgi:hypothetical protein
MAIAVCILDDEVPPRGSTTAHGTASHQRHEPAPFHPPWRDHAEAVALFRAEIIGGLARYLLFPGELAAELRKLASATSGLRSAPSAKHVSPLGEPHSRGSRTCCALLQ